MQQRLIDLILSLIGICTHEQIKAAQALVDQHAPALWAQVPEDHVFRAKEAHANVVADKGLAMLTDMGLNPADNPLAKLVLFIMSIHDIGRAIDALRSLDKLPAGFNAEDDHGTYTVQLLKLWGVMDCFDSEAHIFISFVIKFHATKTTPKMPEGAKPLEELCFLATMLVRDLDKLALFEEKTALYIFSSEEREGQALIIRKRFDPNYTPEDGPISQQILDAYIQRMVDGGKTIIERAWMGNNCEYMVQFLSWICDVNFDAVLKQIVATGAIHTLLGYMINTQPKTVWAHILYWTNNYLSGRNISGEIGAAKAYNNYVSARQKFLHPA